MSNKRELKKSIKYICSELFAECVAASLYNGSLSKEQAETVFAQILAIHNNYVCRVSHPEPGMPTKAYYKNLKESFNKDVDEVIDLICNPS